jgi:hypothetical protein
LWNFKQIFTVVGGLTFIALAIGTYIYFPVLVTKVKSSRYDAKIIGQIVDLQSQEGLLHSKEGSQVTQVKFTITYSYKVNDNQYFNTETIFVSGKVKFALSKIMDTPKKEVLIHYDSRRPTRSMLDLYF